MTATKKTWRRIIAIVTMTCALFATTAAISAPAHAQAAPNYCSFASDQPNYVGWASLAFRGCPVYGMAQTADCRAITAYRWSGTRWTTQYLSECGGPRNVYVYPYAAGWSWIWTQSTGWLAVQSHYVLIQNYGGIGFQVTDAAHAH